MDEDLKMVLKVGLCGILILVGGITSFSEVYGRYQCNNFQEITGKRTRYATLDICYIQTDDGWQRWDEYKARAAASEGLKHAR